MKKQDLIVIFLITLATFVVWRNALSNFFAQDDFIFIEHFSGNNLQVDLKNTFGPPAVTHWRPIHNLYFLISGNLFFKNYYFYHLLIITIHIATSFLIYKIVFVVWRNFKLAGLTSLIYALHPAHFVAMYWISGSAVNIGFLFLSLSLYLYLKNRRLLAFLTYPFALMASEVMAVGLFLFWCINTMKQKKLTIVFQTSLLIVTAVFVTARVLFLTPSAAFETYQFGFDSRVFLAIKYYILRTLGFAETSGDLFISILLMGLLAVILSKFLVYVLKEKRGLIFQVATFLGLLPFILLPAHLSPHYMVLPVFGFSMLLARGLSRFGRGAMIAGLLLFAVISFTNIRITEKNSWVVKRSVLAKNIILDIGNSNYSPGSTIVFDDTADFSSQEKYIALGTGQAVSWWFSDKGYNLCFTFIANC